MQSKLFVLLFVVASVLVMSELAAARKYSNGHKCKNYTDCLSNCCLRNKCIKNSEWCPCSNIRNPCDRTEQVCVPQEVQCVRAPCYPIPNCKPRFLPVQPTPANQ